MTKPIKVMLIEDNLADIELVKIGLESARMLVDMTVITDGNEALHYFTEGKAPPDLILLDINLPNVSGLEILKQLRKNDTYKTVPVIILTSSDAEQDVAIGYREHANSFITKPVDVNQFLDAIRSIENFWLSIVQLPTGKKE
ncbi:response regulator [Teredinibacter waterburyi]|jgi:Response regulators consisting of a CheY-like receiver domain and a winged-helix DNA-binding domain|uniref:response regulator n=1 Tax=Teredinibacter waterburyi TaxID=1500538 RepID=UPI00165ED153|nr:response regulator [Teredinibacter waterburyi]